MRFGLIRVRTPGYHLRDYSGRKLFIRVGFEELAKKRTIARLRLPVKTAVAFRLKIRPSAVEERVEVKEFRFTKRFAPQA